MRVKSFRYCMIIGAIALAAITLRYLIEYFVLGVAIGSSGLKPYYQAAIRALWLSFAFQSLLIATLYALVAWKPHSVSREVIVLFGLLQLVESTLLFAFAGAKFSSLVLAAAALFVLAGSFLWPKQLPADEAAALPHS